MSQLSVPPSVAADAANRAWRTFVQGLMLDVVGALVLALAPALAGADFAWTAGYWKTLALLGAKTMVMTVVSYVARRVVPPAP